MEFERKLKLIRGPWVMSMYTGEIVRPWNLFGIARMVRDMHMHGIRSFDL